ncbi:MAG TPA: hypothetical protein VFT22_12290 [Kofleriaceae bacterium]|nr:hypothetical protein [Kofleriaceae bacterium]
MSEPDDHQWLLLRERGEDVSHVLAARRAKYDRLARLLEALPDDAPDPAWQQHVLAAIDALPAEDGERARGDVPAAGSGTRTRSRRAWILATGLATAATAVVLVLAFRSRAADERAPRGTEPAFVARPEGVTTIAGSSRRTRPSGAIVRLESFSSGTTPSGPVVRLEIRRSGTLHRSGSASVSIGDTLVARVISAQPAELRLYGDTGEPLARCSLARGCPREGDPDHRGFRLELDLAVLGDVRALVFAGDRIPETFGSLADDVEAAQRASVDVRQVGVVHVQ